ncbi:cell wall hydrolase [Paraurantiacibacter namhicola]|uniref:Spore cortex-lytic enzyme n=1 Tax=Paraurantiacibacter namhicola TaxID=645517 RepID=A0A1C7D873_9SPHN|nr:cell wall hydrolase [Paraurantiacibacter namhicola]ANU07658.1 Spore cortex-lytic enzyme precursor [Paraurantiacibacter namhicola]
MAQTTPSCPETLAALLAQRGGLERRETQYRVRRARRGIGTRRKSKPGVSRVAALSLVIAVPSVAASPSGFGFADADALVGQSAMVSPMGFETPGESFPGSAFFYLAEEDFSAPEFAPGVLRDASEDFGADTAGTSALSAAPSAIASALIATGSGTDRTRAQRCLTMAVYYEAASESLDGQRAVAQVVLNRVSHPSYPNSVCGVVFQGSERRTGCQFSFTCDGALARKPSTGGWSRAYGVAADALSGRIYAPVGLATHYHTLAVNPYWASSLHNVGTIGFHTFYTWRGAAGRKSAFNVRYRGMEPMAAPKSRSAAFADSGPTDPLALARQFEAQAAPNAAASSTTRSASAPARAAVPAQRAAPTYTADVEARGGDALFRGDKLPDGGTVNPALERSGQWLKRP